MLAGVVVTTQLGIRAVVFYLAVYLLMNLAAFAVIVARERETGLGDGVASLYGLGANRPALAWPMTIAMLSLAGFPATAGFFGKVTLIGAAVDNGYAWLGVVIVLGSAISLAYYLRVVAAVWMRAPDEARRGAGRRRGAAGDRGRVGRGRRGPGRRRRHGAARRVDAAARAARGGRARHRLRGGDDVLRDLAVAAAEPRAGRRRGVHEPVLGGELPPRPPMGGCDPHPRRARPGRGRVRRDPARGRRGARGRGRRRGGGAGRRRPRRGGGPDRHLHRRRRPLPDGGRGRGGPAAVPHARARRPPGHDRRHRGRAARRARRVAARAALRRQRGRHAARGERGRRDGRGRRVVQPGRASRRARRRRSPPAIAAGARGASPTRRRRARSWTARGATRASPPGARRTSAGTRSRAPPPRRRRPPSPTSRAWAWRPAARRCSGCAGPVTRGRSRSTSAATRPRSRSTSRASRPRPGSRRGVVAELTWVGGVARELVLRAARAGGDRVEEYTARLDLRDPVSRAVAERALRPGGGVPDLRALGGADRVARERRARRLRRRRASSAGSASAGGSASRSASRTSGSPRSAAWSTRSPG